MAERRLGKGNKFQAKHRTLQLDQGKCGQVKTEVTNTWMEWKVDRNSATKTNDEVVKRWNEQT